jgi:hypothetical protein
LLLCAALSLLLLSGCGSGFSPTNTGPGGTYLSLNGNWEIPGIGSPIGTVALPISNFTGALQSNGANVTGTFHSEDFNLQDILSLNPCVTLNQDLPVTGTLDISGNLTLTVLISGGTATIKIPLNANLQFSGIGSYVINGGRCAMAQVSAEASQFVPIAGTYVGTLTPSGSSSTTTVTAMLTQSTTPDADGLFALAGTVQASGAACTGSFTFSGGAVTGNEINLITEAGYQSSNGSLIAAVSPDATQVMSIDTGINGTGCSALKGTLTRQ